MIRVITYDSEGCIFSIKQVNLTGVELRCAVRKNRLVLDDPSLQRLLNRKPEKGRKVSRPTNTEMGLGLERVSVKQATLICRIGEREYRLPFEGELMLPDFETEKKRQQKLLRCRKHD